VVVTGRSREEIGAVAKEIDGLAMEADLAERASTSALLARLAAEIGAVQILVNNAGIAESAPLGKTSDELYDRTMAINATAPFLLMRALLPAMVAAKFGRVVNVASNAGLTGYAYTSAYCASKHALVGLTRAIAMEVATSGVTVNAVCPGFVDTGLSDAAATNIAQKTGKSLDAAKQILASLSPQKRLITTEEVAHAVMMLMPEEARGIHGQTIVLDGGQVMK
jgi:NAD(P)-dependent dehydrogenase (short-subunit alcohol dehydrogenase family)